MDSLGIVVHPHAAVNIKLSVAMEMQQWVPLALLPSHNISYCQQYRVTTKTLLDFK
jgi:hypothetical protein